FAVDAARADHRDLAVQLDEGFENRLAALQGVPRGRRLLWLCDGDLAFSVVAKHRRLEHGGAPDAHEPSGQIVGGAHRRKRTDWKPARGHKCFLAYTVLRDLV